MITYIYRDGKKVKVKENEKSIRELFDGEEPVKVIVPSGLDSRTRYIAMCVLAPGATVETKKC